MMILKNEIELLKIGKILGKVATPPLVIYLTGELGAGKTTFSRGFLAGKGYEGRVKSPTYTLIEPYHLPNVDVFHFDFYRIQHSEELELMGIREFFYGGSICLIEWPEYGEGRIPKPDLEIKFEIIDDGRRLEIKDCSPNGKAVLEQFTRACEA